MYIEIDSFFFNLFSINSIIKATKWCTHDGYREMEWGRKRLWLWAWADPSRERESATLFFYASLWQADKIEHQRRFYKKQSGRFYSIHLILFLHLNCQFCESFLSTLYGKYYNIKNILSLPRTSLTRLKCNLSTTNFNSGIKNHFIIHHVRALSEFFFFEQTIFLSFLSNSQQVSLPFDPTVY